MTTPVHPLAELLPPITDVQFDELTASIKANGQLDAATLFEGKMLDGHHRELACERVGVPCRYEQFPEGRDPLAFVIDKNLKRRHLNESQRAMLASKLANLKNGQTKKPAAHICAASQDDAAKLLNVSRRVVQNAVTVRRQGAPELQNAVERGHVSLGAAVELSVLPQEQQCELVSKGKFAMKGKAAKLRKSKHVRKIAPRYSRCPVIEESQEARDLRMIFGAFDGACPAAQCAFLLDERIQAALRAFQKPPSLRVVS